MEYSRNIPQLDYNLHRIIARVLVESTANAQNICFTPGPIILESNVYDTINSIVARLN
jgi:hypothetical protein